MLVIAQRLVWLVDPLIKQFIEPGPRASSNARASSASFTLEKRSSRSDDAARAPHRSVPSSFFRLRHDLRLHVRDALAHPLLISPTSACQCVLASFEFGLPCAQFAPRRICSTDATGSAMRSESSRSRTSSLPRRSSERPDQLLGDVRGGRRGPGRVRIADAELLSSPSQTSSSASRRRTAGAPRSRAARYGGRARAIGEARGPHAARPSATTSQRKSPGKDRHLEASRVGAPREPRRARPMPRRAAAARVPRRRSGVRRREVPGSRLAAPGSRRRPRPAPDEADIVRERALRSRAARRTRPRAAPQRSTSPPTAA